MEIPEILLERLGRARSVAVLTGAGVSAESGVKTFRDPDGLWATLNPMELASMEGFMANPRAVLRWYRERWDLLRNLNPNPGHLAIAAMEKLFPVFTLITQNVDRLHQKAGSTNVVELHGNLVDNHCMDCRKPAKLPDDIPEGELPRCPYCSGLIRPSVVWFGEMLPDGAMEAAERAAFSCDVFFSVGTSAEVYPAASLPYTAKQAGAFVVEVNPNRTVLSTRADLHLQGPSGVMLPNLLEQYNNYIKEKS